MRRLTLLAIMGIALLLVGFTGRLPSPKEGVYSLKLKTLTLFDLEPKNLPLNWNLAELTDSKPENIEVDGIDYEQFTDIKFGFFRFGNNEEKVWFLMTKNSSDYWNEMYIDQNYDNSISKKERVKSFEITPGRDRGFTTMESFSLVPIPIKVFYKGITREYEQDLYYFVSTISYSKKNATDVIARVVDASFLEGEMTVDTRKKKRLMKFRIVDTNSNGCFNDYGKDLLFMDRNQDGLFTISESQKLVDFFYSTGKEKKQLRMNCLPFSGKLAVTEVTSDFDLSQLEPTPVTSEEEIKPGTKQKQDLNTSQATEVESN